MYDPDSDPENCGRPDGMEILAQYSKLPNHRLEYHANSDTSLIADIKLGVLFIIAFWSGPSRKAFEELTAIINRLDPDETLRFVVIDTDGAARFYEHPEFKGKLHGAGEAAWIKDGVIQSTSGSGYHPDCFEPKTKLLLEMS